MPSAIDATKPVAGSPTTESVRQNFAAAKSEIELLQQTAGVGPQGPTGPTGPAGTITVNPTVITGAPGSNASVTVGGSPSAATLQFTVPRGDTGTGGAGITETQAIDAVKRANPRFEESPVTVSPVWPTGPNLAGVPSVGAGWTPTDGMATTTFTHDSGTGVLAYPAAITGGMLHQIVATMSIGGTATADYFTIFFRNGADVTAGQQSVLIVQANTLASIIVQANANFTHVVIVPVAGWQGNFTLTRIVARGSTTNNSISLSVKDWPVIVRASSGFIGGGGRFATGTSVTVFGSNAGDKLTTATNMVAIGANAMLNTSTGAANTVVGFSGLQNNQTGASNTVMGYQAMLSGTMCQNNVGLGRRALYASRGGSMNCAVGYYAMNGGAGNATQNVAVGTYAGTTLIGHYNVAIGYYSLAGANTVAAVQNVAVGYQAGRYIANGTTANVAQAGNVYIGGNSKSAASLQTNQIVIGYNAVGGGSNTITLGNGDITQLRCNVQDISALSDVRVKDEIELADLNRCLDAVKDLPVHRWHWQPVAGFRRDRHVTGFLSGDLRKIWPHRVTEEDEYLTVRDEDGNPVYKTITETIPADPDDEGSEAQVITRQILDTVKIEGLARVELTEALPTLWGAVQRLIQEVEELRSGSQQPSPQQQGGDWQQPQGGGWQGGD